MPYCSALNCSSNEKNARLFIFPKEEKRRQVWTTACAKPNWFPKSGSRLCEQHFTKDQFERHRNDGWKKLKCNAVPTIFNIEKQTHLVEEIQSQNIKEEREEAISPVSFNDPHCISEKTLMHHFTTDHFEKCNPVPRIFNIEKQPHLVEEIQIQNIKEEEEEAISPVNFNDPHSISSEKTLRHHFTTDHFEKCNPVSRIFNIEKQPHLVIEEIQIPNIKEEEEDDHCIRNESNEDDVNDELVKLRTLLQNKEKELWRAKKEIQILKRKNKTLADKIQRCPLLNKGLVVVLGQQRVIK